MIDSDDPADQEMLELLRRFSRATMREAEKAQRRRRADADKDGTLRNLRRELLVTGREAGLLDPVRGAKRGSD